MSHIIGKRVFASILGYEKRLQIYLPDDLSDERPIPLIIMHDGHNLFDPETAAFGVTWEAKAALNQIAQTGHPMIVVGIEADPDRRFDEYAPWESTTLPQLMPWLGDRVYGGKGADYIKWIVEELMPDIQASYPIDPSCISLAGSSMGGYISLYGGFKYPDVFSHVGCFSPAVWFNETGLSDFIQTHFASHLALYLDMGTDETSNPEVDDFPRIYL
ncbi:MAG: alpha/beta hydrolase-fold protein, partial [Candidatus Izemoplasmatales bacterium]|nr:alpha/beta hydrolase-fold protein [Candidatus Izemoplasmatales bacterium]